MECSFSTSKANKGKLAFGFDFLLKMISTFSSDFSDEYFHACTACAHNVQSQIHGRHTRLRSTAPAENEEEQEPA